MRVTMATASGRPDGRNEDWAGATPDLAVVLDGLTEGPATGCAHGTPWFVHELGARLLLLGRDETVGLAEVLAAAIGQVAGTHAGTCDLSHPGSPSTTVTMVRERGPRVDYLVLSDSAIVFDPGPVVVTDTSVQGFLAAETAVANADHGALHGLIGAQQAIRNTPEGYWVARTEPEAARHARTGTVTGVRRAVLLSDGAARPVVDFAAMTWPELLDLTPGALLAATRRLEDSDPHGTRWPRSKVYDDATAVYCRFDNPAT